LAQVVGDDDDDDDDDDDGGGERFEAEARTNCAE
jgi:hypothetical protein